MAEVARRHKPVTKGVSIVGKEAYADYMEFSKIRDPKKFTYYKDYGRITRKIWKKIAEDSMEYESGVYAPKFFYLIPQVIANRPYIETRGGEIQSNDHTNGDMYTPVFCNLMYNVRYKIWYLDGTYVHSYIKRLTEKIRASVPTYYFILMTLLKSK